MGLFHYTNNIRLLQQLAADLIPSPRLSPRRGDPHWCTHFGQQHGGCRAAIHVAGANHEDLLHGERCCSTAGTALFELAQPLVIVFGLDRDAIVETLKLSCQARQRFAGLFQLSIEMFDQCFG